MAQMASPEHHSRNQRALIDTTIVGLTAALAIFLYWIVDAVSMSSHWNFLLSPPFGPLSGTASFLITDFLPGVPYLVAGRRAWVSAQACGTGSRRTIRAIVLLLSIPSLWWIWSFVWFLIVMLPYGGRF